MPDGLWGKLIVAMAFFVLGRVIAGVGAGRRERDDANAVRNLYKSRIPAHGPTSASSRLNVSAGLGAELRPLILRGDLIEAIKRYREETGAGLKESKDAVEAFREQLRQQRLI